MWVERVKVCMRGGARLASIYARREHSTHSSASASPSPLCSPPFITPSLLCPLRGSHPWLSLPPLPL